MSTLFYNLCSYSMIMSYYIYSDKMSCMREEIYNMTQKEISRLGVINQTIDKVITIKDAAEVLNLS